MTDSDTPLSPEALELVGMTPGETGLESLELETLTGETVHFVARDGEIHVVDEIDD